MKHSRHTVIVLAAQAYVDPRTAAKWLRSEPVRELTSDRIAAAARELGIERAKPLAPQSIAASE